MQGARRWRLGSEDPSIWDIWDTTHATDADRNKLTEVPPGYDLILEGHGDIWHITNTPKVANATLITTRNRTPSTTKALKCYPVAWRIEQVGAAPHKLALSFDDGPDPTWTPEILDILKAEASPRHILHHR